ncbi:MAG TPA: hypothetical protein VFU21_16840 [Kofleriaceae bacterium]|nr:hypothetical protein [Kofleriaceae bacterium]
MKEKQHTPEEEQGKTDLEPARRYREKVAQHERTSDTEQEAEEARRDLEGPEGDELRQAEEAGRAHIAEEDPEIDCVSKKLKDRERGR